MARDRKEFKKQIHQVDADCEELIRKHLDKGVHPLTICGALITNVSELCKNGSLDKQEFMSMVESTWNLFDDVEESLRVIH
jgi:hypothetical protein